MRSSRTTRSVLTNWRPASRIGLRSELQRSPELQKRAFNRRQNGGEQPKPVFSCTPAVSNTAAMGFRMFWVRSILSWHQDGLVEKAAVTERLPAKGTVKVHVNMARTAMSCQGCATSATLNTVHTLRVFGAWIPTNCRKPAWTLMRFSARSIAAKFVDCFRSLSIQLFLCLTTTLSG